MPPARPVLYRVDDPVAETIALLRHLPDPLLATVSETVVNKFLKTQFG